MMMRKKTKMAWSVALSAAMAAGLLAGCGSNGGAESTSGSTAASSAKTESSAGDTADTSDRPTYKIATVRWILKDFNLSRMRVLCFQRPVTAGKASIFCRAYTQCIFPPRFDADGLAIVGIN